MEWIVWTWYDENEHGRWWEITYKSWIKVRWLGRLFRRVRKTGIIIVSIGSRHYYPKMKRISLISPFYSNESARVCASACPLERYERDDWYSLLWFSSNGMLIYWKVISSLFLFDNMKIFDICRRRGADLPDPFHRIARTRFSEKEAAWIMPYFPCAYPISMVIYGKDLFTINTVGCVHTWKSLLL